MDRSNVLKLIHMDFQVDSIGQPVPVETVREVYCDLRSVSRAEWSAAGQLGLKPDLVAVMFAPDYQGENLAEIAAPIASVESSYLLDEDRRQLAASDGQPLRDDGDVVIGSPVRYGIYRTYLGRNETIELYMERKVGVTNG